MEFDDILRDIAVRLEDVQRRGRIELGLMIHGSRHLQVEERKMRTAATQNSVFFDVNARDPFADQRARARGMFVGL